jgi:WD40 repeat protein
LILDCPANRAKSTAKTLAPTTGRIHLYEVATGQETRTIDTPPLRSRSLAFTPDGQRLVTGMADASVLIWDVRAER